MVTTKRAEVLIVDDEQIDVNLLKRFFVKSKFPNNVTVAMDGVEAMQALRQEGAFKNSPLPDLIIMDLNMPKRDGISVLKEIRQDDNLKMIPVIIMTTSCSDHDVTQSYSEYANCYIQKPLEMNKLEEIVETIADFWFGIVILPSKNA